MDDLLNPVAETQDELERLKSTTESEEEIGYWNQALASLRQEQPPEITKDQGDSLSIPQQGKGGS